MVMVAVLGIIAAAISSRAGQLAQNAKKFRELREIQGAFGYVENLAACSRVATCAGPVALYPKDGAVPLVAVPHSVIVVGKNPVKFRAQCTLYGSVKRVAVETRTATTWKEVGAIVCN